MVGFFCKYNMDKISFYNVSFEYNGYNLLYNTLSDSLLCLTQEESEIVKLLFENLGCFSEEYPTLYTGLKNTGFIVNTDYNELDYIKLQNKRKIFVDRDFHITINPTLDCNLKCWYCSTKFAKAKHTGGGMSSNVVQSVIAHIKRVIHEGKASSLHLDWFGGEPLLYFDEVIEPISVYANQLVNENNVRFSQHITTNATLIGIDRIHRMKELNFTSFQIPIDGNEQRHNKIKCFQGREGTYKLVMDNINMIASIISNVNIILRINYDKQTLKKIQDVIKDISEESKSKIYIDFQRVWQVACEEKERNLLKISKENFRINGLNSNFWAYRPQTFHRCYADKYYQYSINYDGKIFKCTAHDYGEDKVIGILLSNGEVKWNDKLLGDLFSKSTFENERCLKCKILPICMGPCIHRNYESRKLNKPLPCISEYAEYSLIAYIIEKAKKKCLIKEM